MHGKTSFTQSATPACKGLERGTYFLDPISLISELTDEVKLVVVDETGLVMDHDYNSSY